MINRESAYCLLTEFTQSESLRKHALAVEACMRACSRKFGDGSPEAEILWGVVGLIHDFDYERWPTPEEHPVQRKRNSQGARLLRRDPPRHHVARRILWRLPRYADGKSLSSPATNSRDSLPPLH